MQLVAIFGPTAVGKSEIAVELARLLREQGELPVAVSADAFQVYEGLDVLTAKPTADQLEALEHRLVSFVPVTETYSVAQYAQRAHEEVDRLLTEGRRPIVVGGTGLYLRAALTDLELKPPADPRLREQLEGELVELGLRALHAQLPAETADAVHPNDRKRIVRALELERMGETAYRSSDPLWSAQQRRPALLFGVTMEQEARTERISERVERMLEAGAVEEVERALERGASATARKAIGFAEIEALIDGRISHQAAAERIARRQRQYAKRQLTWMRKLSGVQSIDRTGLDGAETAAGILTAAFAARPA